MKIVVVESYIAHYETLGYFFYLKKRRPDIDITIYAANVNDTWLTFFNDEISNIDIRDISKVHHTIIEADFLFINTIDIYPPYVNNQIKALDMHMHKFVNFHRFTNIKIQLHCGQNIMANRYEKLKHRCNMKKRNFDIVSPFPNQDCIRIIMPYNHDENVGESVILPNKLRLAAVGAVKKINQNTIKTISSHFDITHYHREGYGTDKPINGVKYVVDATTKELVKYLQSNANYILIDYEFTDRMTGIIIQAISLEIPFIVNKSYADKLNIPDNIYITYETGDDLIKNTKLHDSEYYSELKSNIKKYKMNLIDECDKMIGINE